MCVETPVLLSSLMLHVLNHECYTFHCETTAAASVSSSLSDSASPDASSLMDSEGGLNRVRPEQQSRCVCTDLRVLQKINKRIENAAEFNHELAMV